MARLTLLLLAYSLSCFVFGVHGAYKEKVKSIIVEQLGVEIDELLPDASFVDDLGADSLDVVELVMALEEEFGLEIPDDDAEKLTTVSNVIYYVYINAELSD